LLLARQDNCLDFCEISQKGLFTSNWF